jgi:hypothetical protein
MQALKALKAFRFSAHLTTTMIATSASSVENIDLFEDFRRDSCGNGGAQKYGSCKLGIDEHDM